MDLVTVGTYADVVGAHLARVRLEEAGIASYVFDENLISVQWLYTTALGGVRLKVADVDLERALRILDQSDPAPLADLAESKLPASSGDSCPECGAERVRSSRLFRSTLAISLWTTVPLYLWRQRWVCEGCGHVWRMKPGPPSTLRQSTRDAEQQVRGEMGSYPGVLAFLLVLAVLLASFVIKQWSAT